MGIGRLEGRAAGLHLAVSVSCWLDGVCMAEWRTFVEAQRTRTGGSAAAPGSRAAATSASKSSPPVTRIADEEFALSLLPRLGIPEAEVLRSCGSSHFAFLPVAQTLCWIISLDGLGGCGLRAWETRAACSQSVIAGWASWRQIAGADYGGVRRTLEFHRRRLLLESVSPPLFHLSS